jgi:hypothetical protein
MPTFVIEHIEEFDTKQKVNKLVRNGKCIVDEFVEEIRQDNNLSPELGELYAIIEDIANNQLLPPNRYKKLRVSKKLKFKPYEAKSKHLRLYLFHENGTGQIIVLGGKKKDQKEDIQRLEKLISEYNSYLQD